MKRVYTAAMFLLGVQMLNAQTVSISVNNSEQTVNAGDTVKVAAKPALVKIKIKADNPARMYTIGAGNEIQAKDFPGDDKFHDIPATFAFAGATQTSGDVTIKEKATNKEIIKFKLQLDTAARKFSLFFNDKTVDLADQQKIPIDKMPAKISLAINDPGNVYVISKGEEIKDVEVAGDNKRVDIAFNNVSFGRSGVATIQVTKKGTNDLVRTFHFINTNVANVNKTGGGSGGRDSTGYIPPFKKFYDGLGFKIDPTPYGLIVSEGNSLYLGKKYVHIFLDQYGNSWNGTIPQGIADRQYVVHVIYLTGIQNNLVVFDVKKKKGSFNPALNYLNSDFRKDKASEATAGRISDYTWVHQEFLLGTSTTDIEFELTKTVIANGDEPYDSKNESLGTYTIQMTPVYHGSFNVGFVTTNLANPTYALFDNPANTDEKVVKRSEDGKRTVLTFMATAYTSIPIIIEKLTGADIPWNKTYSRNFLDDHRLFERFYPAIGVGFTDKTLENIFYGIDWEVTRGLGVFAGWHRGKINTYNAPPDFKFSETVTSEAEFNLRSDRQWKTKFAIGINIDPLVVTKLLSAGLK
jgi:hypothetical protein